MKSNMQWRTTLSTPPKKESECKINFNLLPDEMILHIFAFLPTEALLRTRGVCSRWRNLTSSKQLWREVDVKFDMNEVGYPNAYRILQAAPILRSLTLCNINLARHAASTIDRIIECSPKCAPQKLTLYKITVKQEPLVKILLHFVEKIERLELFNLRFTSSLSAHTRSEACRLENLLTTPDCFTEEPAYADLLSVSLEDYLHVDDNDNPDVMYDPGDLLSIFEKCQEVSKAPLRSLVISGVSNLPSYTADFCAAGRLINLFPNLETFSLFCGENLVKDRKHLIRFTNGNRLSLEIRDTVNNSNSYWEAIKDDFSGRIASSSAFMLVQDLALTCSVKGLSVLDKISSFPNLKKLQLTYCCPTEKSSYDCCTKYLSKISSLRLPPRRIASQIGDLRVSGCSVFLSRFRDALKEHFRNASKIDFEVTVPGGLSDTSDFSDSSSEWPSSD